MENLRKRGIEGPMRCILCKYFKETMEHLFIESNFSQEVWQQAFKELNTGITLPTNFNDFFECWKEYYHGSFYNKPDFVRAWEALPKFICWKLWITRNKDIFEAKKNSLGKVTASGKAL